MDVSMNVTNYGCLFLCAILITRVRANKQLGEAPAQDPNFKLTDL